MCKERSVLPVQYNIHRWAPINWTNYCSGDRCTRRPVPDNPPVPLHGLAGAGRTQVRGGIHRLHRTGPQDQGAVRPGGTNHRPLQVWMDQSPWTAVIWMDQSPFTAGIRMDQSPFTAGIWMDQSPFTAGMDGPITVHCRYGWTNHQSLQVWSDQSPCTTGMDGPITAHCRYGWTNHRSLQVWMDQPLATRRSF